MAKMWESAERGTKQIQESTATRSQILSATRSQKRHQPMSRKKAYTCFRCGGSHSQVGCRFKDVSCNYCGKKGHIAKVCYSRERDNKQKQSHHQLTNTNTKEETAGTTEYSMHHASTDTLRTSKNTPWSCSAEQEEALKKGITVPHVRLSSRSL